MLKGKCAVITGASRGIGKCIATKFAKEGANVVINYRNNEEEALKVKQELEDLGSQVLVVKADVSELEQAENLIKEAKKEFGRVDILVNNAGITKDNLIIRMKEEDFDSVIKTNLKGAFNCLKAVTPIMLKQKYGKIVNMASVVGLVGNPGQVNYCASKAGLIGMTKSLAKEIGSRNITVNAIAPGFIDTDMTKILSDDQKKKILSQIPLNKFGNVEDIANVALFLGSENSNYITGQVIHVDGGMAM
ncbi:3-oxoacyl-[acyl-carrier-protein] reductase [Intestinibacter bartlettii]|uniref:3-oxoacyl-[acyl-carrier-protein] reductase n=1 Tax=Intestinibacter bartlettii TaxID=261299 RepID=UPI002903F13B|nr:3-oxoacyl-[acyl-carrier-protein] reductase [Intestinibacter bartlettii]MDU2164071.1 3-oxoacyl-[acyl-carrier-protein] reductase [Intestinibacter bartlettii]